LLEYQARIGLACRYWTENLGPSKGWQSLGMTTRTVLTPGMAIDGELTACLALNGKCLWAASSPTVGFGVKHDDDLSLVRDGCTLAFGAGLMSATGCPVVAAHIDLAFGLERLDTTA